MKPTLPLIVPFLWNLTAATTTPLNTKPPNHAPATRIIRPDLPRLVLYHQTTHNPSTGRPISLLPLVHKQHIALTHLIVGAFHVHANRTIYLNDHPPRHARFHTLWNETAVLQAAGVKVLAMVGGAAPGSFDRFTLDALDRGVFERSYALLRDVVVEFGLDGVDLDVEERMSQRGITRLVRRLSADFGPGFVITLAPVATALVGGGNLSGFDYGRLERVVGGRIAFYNAQFYNGFGFMGTTRLFDRLVAGDETRGRRGWDPKRIVVGQLTSPVNGAGFVRHERLARAVSVLRRRCGEIGGFAGWEYFNAFPGGQAQPWRWAESMTAILRPGREPTLRITREVAERLTEAWVESAVAAKEETQGSGPGLWMAERWAGLVPDVEYLSMVNESSDQ